MKKIIPTIIIIALAAWGVYYFTVRSTSSIAVDGINATSSDMLSYSHAARGISFMYPEGYVIDEAGRGTGGRGHYSIVLVRDEDRVPPVNGEGPTAITVDLYDNAVDKQSLTGWLNNSSASNFKLSNGTYASTTVAGVPAVTYTWSGLYEGRTTAFIHGNTIVALSVTFMSPEDDNLVVYDIVRTSIKLSTAGTATSTATTTSR